MKWLLLLLNVAFAYKQEHFDIGFEPSSVHTTDSCTLFVSTVLNRAVLRHHVDQTIQNTTHSSDIAAVNQDCSMVLFGYPDEKVSNMDIADGSGVVRVWKPASQVTHLVRPNLIDISWMPSTKYSYNEPEPVYVHRFGFSLDIQGDTWIVGAPGKLSRVGVPSSQGYAFVYKDTDLHSCRSQFENGCYPEESDCVVGYSAWQKYYGFYWHGGTSAVLKDDEVNDFQKKCIPEQTPNYRGGYYGGGQLDPVLATYFVWQQFGYDVAITGSFEESSAALFVSAPGDTNRFIENNPHEEGRNYGRVFAWDLSTNADIKWWEPNIYSPYGPPNARGSHYRAYGRAIAASKSLLVVSSYPMYFKTREPFVIVYDCNPKLSNCVESENRGIAIDDIPGNALSYLTARDLSYSDRTKKFAAGYVIAPDYQNEFIGDEIGIVGSNIVITDKHSTPHPQMHRFDKDARLRESHAFSHTMGHSTNTKHIVLTHGKSVTHYSPCPTGYTGGAPESFESDGNARRGEHCLACEISYYSDDGWLKECNLCPLNRTTYKEGQHECVPWSVEEQSVMEWAEARTIMVVIVVAAVALWLLLLACQYACYSGRKKRKF